MSKPTTDFESLMTRLEQVVEEMERGEISLEEAVELFEEGTRLAKKCEEKLVRVEEKVAILMKKDHEWTETPFQLEGDAESL
ncbi:exodeoxyribonuclease VII small subunit [Mechercharimyces sp. CAU 1602]|uniref:exodeoxyribonuclease VII small subunit n=1 Tax=Mechercharimyces sp. CAU 1602 TaxID=2973933 RepID=UPI00216131FF|nr:exodeoxyribonuclease VII small subunit [Mechercharimyces sp. CAU 1602]MCS1350787.1 exodeoxyribonuclease VII small subunit [Mechercharimyces sp. CAU 1602]